MNIWWTNWTKISLRVRVCAAPLMSTAGSSVRPWVKSGTVLLWSGRVWLGGRCAVLCPDIGESMYGVCVLFCFVDPILGKWRSRCHSLNQGTWGGRILTLHLNCVAGYTGPLLFLFERTHNYSVDNQGLVPWRLRRLGRSKVRSDSSVRCVPGSNRQTRGKPRPLTTWTNNDHRT